MQLTPTGDLAHRVKEKEEEEDLSNLLIYGYANLCIDRVGSFLPVGGKNGFFPRKKIGVAKIVFAT